MIINSLDKRGDYGDFVVEAHSTASSAIVGC